MPDVKTKVKAISIDKRLLEILKKENKTLFSPEQVLAISVGVNILGDNHEEMKELFAELVDSYQTYKGTKLAQELKDEFNEWMDVQVEEVRAMKSAGSL